VTRAITEEREGEWVGKKGQGTELWIRMKIKKHIVISSNYAGPDLIRLKATSDIQHSVSMVAFLASPKVLGTDYQIRWKPWNVHG
jgi:hypothetical protein